MAKAASTVCGILLLLAGCALGRATVEIPQDRGPASATGPAVTFVKVTDTRRFEAAPRDPSIPSLQDAADIHNPAITSRAIARKRGSYGAAFGDIVLPEGQTAAGLVENAIARGFTRAGYRVVANDTTETGVIPIEVQVEELWAWFTPGFAAIAVECKVRAAVSAPSTPFADRGVVSTRVRDTGFAATESMWVAIVQKALDDISNQVHQRLVRATATP
jgi:hypothetical protein